MATNFPGGIDTFVNPNATSSLDSPSHAGLHTDMGDAMTAVQTELVNNPSGLVHIQTTSFTTSSAVNVNDVFTSTYDNYRIIVSYLGSATNQSLGLRLRVSGSDNTTLNYNIQQFDVFGSSTSPSRATGQSSFAAFSAYSTGDFNNISFDIFKPNLATPTSYNSYGTSSIDNIFIRFSTGGFNANTVFDGFSFLPQSGTLTGTYSVYGYRKN
jgi:hypothetical protein